MTVSMLQLLPFQSDVFFEEGSMNHSCGPATQLHSGWPLDECRLCAASAVHLYVVDPTGL